MKEKLYELLSTITKIKDDYGNGVSIRFKDDGGNTIGIIRYGNNGGRYIMTYANIFGLMEILNEKLDFKEGDLPMVDKVIKDFCLDYLSDKSMVV